MSDDEVVLAEVADRVGVITLNRPDQRNALNGAVQRRLSALISDLDADDGVDVLVLTGADPAFCAGVDLKELGGGERSLVLPKEQRGPFPPHSKPLIGAVNGVAVTGGLEIALACDFLIASDRARFADTHSRVGIQPGWGLATMLSQAVGVRRARQMSMTGNYVDALTALAWGLVNQVVPHEELLPVTLALAADIVSNDQVAARRLLATYAAVTGTTVDEGWALEVGVANEWAREHMDPAEVARRRQAIVERGRARQ